jgi:hypothetical protein
LASVITRQEITRLALDLGYTLRPVAAGDVPVLDALRSAWEAIREQDNRLPSAVFDLQPRHPSTCSSVEWSTAPIIVLSLKHASGENLAGRDVLAELLHLAGHAASYEATGSEGRYHSAEFAETARGLGLSVSAQRTAGVGYQPEGLARGTVSRYQEQIRALDKALKGWHPEVIRKRDRSAILLTCSCNPPRKMRMSPGVAALGPVTCEICGQEFRIASASASP